MKKMLSRKLTCFAICSILAISPVQATAAEPCERKLSAALEALAARELHAEACGELAAEQRAHIAGLKWQHGEAVELARGAPTPWLSRELVFVLGVVAGAVVTAAAAGAFR